MLFNFQNARGVEVAGKTNRRVCFDVRFLPFFATRKNLEQNACLLGTQKGRWKFVIEIHLLKLLVGIDGVVSPAV